jgi:hypothetical protein
LFQLLTTPPFSKNIANGFSALKCAQIGGQTGWSAPKASGDFFFKTVVPFLRQLLEIIAVDFRYPGFCRSISRARAAFNSNIPRGTEAKFRTSFQAP